MPLFFLLLCFLFQGRASRALAKPAPLRAIPRWTLPDSDLTGRFFPNRADILEKSDSAAHSGVGYVVMDSATIHEQVLIFRDTVARRIIEWTESDETDLVKRLSSVRERISSELGAPLDSGVVTESRDSGWRVATRETRTWSDPGGRVRLDLLRPAFGKSFHSEKNKADSSSTSSGEMLDIEELLRDTTLPAGIVRITFWNRLHRHTAAMAMADCLRWPGCALPPDLGTLVPGSDSLAATGEGLLPEWLPEIQDTFRQENDRFLDGKFGKFDELVGYGTLDSSYQFQILTPLAGSAYRKTIADSVQVWTANGVQEGLEEKYDEIAKALPDSLSDSTKERLFRTLPDAFTDVVGTIAAATSKPFLDSLDYPVLLVRKRPVRHPWPLRKDDITQSFKPIARRPTRARDLPEHHPIGYLGSFEDNGLQQVVFVEGEVEQRTLTYSRAVSGMVSMHLDSVFLDNLGKLRIEFGHEERITLDTITSSDKTDMLVETRWWHRGGAQIRLERSETFEDTGEYRRTVEAVLKKLPSVDPTVDSTRIQEIRKERFDEWSDHRPDVLMVRLFLTNPMEPTRFARAMANCLEDSGCSLPPESGFTTSGDSLYAVGPEIPSSWFPKGESPIVKTIDDTASSLQKLLCIRKFPGTIDGTHGFDRTVIGLLPGAEDKFREIADSLLEQGINEYPDKAKETSAFESLFLSEYGGILAHTLAATCRFYSRIQSLAVFRTGTPTLPRTQAIPTNPLRDRGE